MKKILIAGALALGLFVGVQSASAFTAQEIEMLITLLNLDSTKAATLRAMVSSAPAAAPAFTFTRNLTIGSTGADVTALQEKLGVTPATGYFGPITKAAVVAWQAANGITPTSGYVGPLTIAKLNMTAPVTPVTPSTPGTPTTPGVTTLEGTDGTISDISRLTQYNNEEVGDGQSNVKVAGFEVEASNDGDISLRSMKVVFRQSNTADSRKITDYVDTVSIYQGSNKIGSADASDFNKDNTGEYSKTITLSNSVVRADSKEKFYVSIDAISNLDTSDVNSETASIEVTNIRYEDGSGVVTTESGSDLVDLNGTQISMDFVDFATAADTEVKVSLDDNATPDVGIVSVDTETDTDHVLMLVGKIKVEGDSDILINSLPVSVITAGATGTAGVASSITLEIDGDEYSESLSSTTQQTTVVTFDDLDINVGAGDTISFKVYADINDLQAGSFDAGDDLTVSMTAANADAMDLENEEGDSITDSDISGSATGNAQAFYADGIAVVKKSVATPIVTDESQSNVAAKGTYTFNLAISAFGDDAYIATTSSAVTKSIFGSTFTGTSTVTIDSDADIVGGDYKIAEGTTENFTVTVVLYNGTTPAGTFGVKVDTVKFGIAAGSATTYTVDVSDLNIKSSSVSLN